MADITAVRPRPCTPAGYEFNDVCEVASDVSAGDLLVYTGAMSGSMAVMDVAAVDAAEVHGIALQDAKDGDRGVDVGIIGEMDGYAGLTPGTKLFRSGTTAGAIGDTAVATQTARIKAVTDSRIRYSF